MLKIIALRCRAIELQASDIQIVAKVYQTIGIKNKSLILWLPGIKTLSQCRELR